jgi:hypothetical protein
MTAPLGLQYLTVQDILWTNLQLTKESNPFEYDKLEEATFCQYAYGKSIDPVAQAPKFLKGFIAKAPFGGKGDTETAFIATIGYLTLNGYLLPIPAAECRAWLERVKSGQVDATQAISQLAQPATHHHVTTPQEALQAALDLYAGAITRSQQS